MRRFADSITGDTTATSSEAGTDMCVNTNGPTSDCELPPPADADAANAMLEDD